MKPSNASKVSVKKVADHWVASSGSVAVKIYQSSGRDGQTLFTVVYYIGPQRKRDVRTSWESAKAHAETVVQDMSRGDIAVGQLSAQDRVSFARAQALLEPRGVSVDLGAYQLVDALQRLNGASLGHAIDFFMKRNPGGMCQKTVDEVKVEFLAAKAADGRGSRHLKDLTLRIGKFAEAFQCPIASVTTADLSAWLRGMKCTGRSRNNYRNAVRNLFGYAQGVGYVCADQINWNPRNGAALADEGNQVIEIFSCGELQKLLAAAQLDPDDLPNGVNRRYATSQGLLPLLVLGAFCGLRTSEACAQLWSDIHLDRGFLRVTQAKGNTPAKRLVPLTDNAKAWLQSLWRAEGTCCDYPRVEDAISRLAARAGIPWKHNALRHSFISYRVADVRNVPQVAIEAGNSPRMIDKHYRELVTGEDGKAWFSIMPQAPAENVLPMPARQIA